MLYDSSPTSAIMSAYMSVWLFNRPFRLLVWQNQTLHWL